MPVKLDKKDWKILEALCTDARQSHNQIAKQVGLSKNAVTYRIDRLFKNGVIGGFSTVIDSGKLGYGFYDILFKVHGTEEQEAELIDYLKKHPQVLVFEKISGSWDYVLEMGCKELSEFCEFMRSVKRRFSKLIMKYEVHQVLEQYKVEQFPVELLKPREVKSFIQEERMEIDEIDRKLLYLLSEDAKIMLHVLAEKFGLTTETVSARLKKLREKRIIINHTAQVYIPILGYEIYIIRIDLQNMTEETESALRSYLIQHTHIRYAYMSATEQSVFVHFAAKTPMELDNFLNELKEKFFEMIVNTDYMWSRKLYKYSLFPKGFV